MTEPWQVAHIKEYADQFATDVTDEPIERYFHDRASDAELYLGICSDLGIEPRTRPWPPLREFLANLRCEFPTVVYTLDDDSTRVRASMNPDRTWMIERIE